MVTCCTRSSCCFATTTELPLVYQLAVCLVPCVSAVCMLLCAVRCGFRSCGDVYVRHLGYWCRFFVSVRRISPFRPLLLELCDSLAALRAGVLSLKYLSRVLLQRGLWG